MRRLPRRIKNSFLESYHMDSRLEDHSRKIQEEMGRSLLVEKESSQMRSGDRTYRRLDKNVLTTYNTNAQEHVKS
jgi:hypothetical protein